ncbi:uncharacterized protein N7511_005119 [Penicillium nucicola]|uniref:uncharacterized protein n=1 Tax=Penicillium nucicola TaxID=1850975 RepID=UPI0025451AD3|nr:uncharacterized protein N7511_005119 [Penicillium nucicola]KAJ5761737.1 hypothetical protein N7511_005119 [Penicillium nucicola]
MFCALFLLTLFLSSPFSCQKAEAGPIISVTSPTDTNPSEPSVAVANRQHNPFGQFGPYSNQLRQNSQPAAPDKALSTLLDTDHLRKDCDHLIETYDPPYIGTENLNILCTMSRDGSTLKEDVLHCLSLTIGHVELMEEAIDRHCLHIAT